MGDPFFDLGNFSINNELTEDEDAAFLLAAYDGVAAPRPDRLARLALFRVVSDFREAMWGVLQQGISTLDVDFRGLRRRPLRAAARERRHAALRALAERGERRLTRSPAAAGRLGGGASPADETGPTVTDRRRRDLRRGRGGDARRGVAARRPAAARAGDGRRGWLRAAEPIGGAVRARLRPRRRCPPRSLRRPRRRHRTSRPPRRPTTRSSSAPATSPAAAPTTTRRPRGWSRTTRASCSRSATTRTTAGRRPSSATATARRGAASRTGTELPVAGNHDYGTPNAAGYRGLLRPARHAGWRHLVFARHRRAGT